MMSKKKKELSSFKALGEALGLESSANSEPSSQTGRDPAKKAHQKHERVTGSITGVKQQYGFIKIEGFKKEVYFRFNNFSPPIPPEQIQQGVEVSCEVIEGDRGKRAVKLQMIASSKPIHHETDQHFVRPKEKLEGRLSEQYYLPKDTRNIVESKLEGILEWTNTSKTRNKVPPIDNFSLFLNKCALYDRWDQHKFSVYIKRKRDKKKDVPGYQVAPKFDQDFNILLDDVRERQKKSITDLGLALANIPPFKVDWRLIVGLGNESVYETSMTLHHVYGIPYIPGQAVKGVLRSWMILTKFGTKKIQDENGEYVEQPDPEHAEERALQNIGFCDIFGCPKESGYKEARQGKVFFFDAFPTNLTEKSIQPDIMNPHYGPYYQENKPPADYHDPRPITFLTVQDTSFEFFVGIKPADNKEIRDSKIGMGKVLDIVKQSLTSALQDHGIGAKTAVGYGYFSE